MQQETEADLYIRLAPYYDWMSRALLAPFGGDQRFRTRVVASWRIEPGQRVLELGCGTGLMTQHLLAAGAEVTAVDRSAPMLERARRRAPAASFVLEELTAVTLAGSFDRVVLSYVLHELTDVERSTVLRLARDVLAAHGLLAVVDFHFGGPALVRRCLDLYLRIAEPPSARTWARDGFVAELVRAGFTFVHEAAVGWGTARTALLAPG